MAWYYKNNYQTNNFLHMQLPNLLSISKYVVLSIVFIVISSNNNYLKAQLVSYELLFEYDLDDLDNFIEDLGLPPLFGTPIFGIRYYKVVYETPYLHPDSLVNATGAIIVPIGADCSFPICSYGHGTQAKRGQGASEAAGQQYEVGIVLSSQGYVMCMPDYIGLGTEDLEVLIHPYTHAESQANTTINIMRAARQIAELEEVGLNGQIFLTGYSQGGFTTVAAHKEIEANYSDEFQITASAPMSGAYDLTGVQADLINTNDPYPTPGYLPYIILAYETIYGNLFNTPGEIFKSPYDTLIPPLFYSGDYTIGYINEQCPPVPKDIIKDSVINAFETNLDHPLRLALADNELLDWTPQNPIKLLYCEGDDQVTYLNSEIAYDTWTASGAPFVEKQDFGMLNHNDCALFTFLNTRQYFNSYAVIDCLVGTNDVAELANSIVVQPNPADNVIRFIDMPAESQTFTIYIYNINGQLVNTTINSPQLRVSDWASGAYFYQWVGTSTQQVFTGKFMVY